jgi:carboxypeptidase family protein/TonB-dependent receptor-like protein
MCRHRFLWLACLSLLSFPLSLSAQTTTGTIRGYVKDQNGTPVTDAEVQARQAGTGVTRSTASRSDGSYIIPGLVPGNYELSVRKIGFTPQRRQIAAEIGATQIIDFSLQAGAVELQAITVVPAPTVELRTSEVAVNITPQQMQQLPTPSRNFLDLSALAPGVQVTEDRVDGTSRTFRSGGMGANSSNVFVDGSSLKNDLTQGGVSGQDASRGNPFPRSAIQEYRVISQNFKAEYQKATGAIITATTRSGTNQWTGNAFVGYQDKGLLALDTFQLRDKRVADSIALKNGTPTTFQVPDYSRVLTSLSGGGPLIRNRLFFFGSYEGNYQDRANRVSIQTPTGYPSLDTANLTRYNGNFTSPFRETLLFGKLNYAIDQRSSAEFSFNTRHETDVKGFGGGAALSTANNFRQDVSIAQFRYNRFWGGWLDEMKIDFSRFRRDPSPNTPGTPQRLFHSKLPDIRIGSDLSTQDFIQKRVGLRNDLTYNGLQQHTFKGGVSVDFVKYDIRKLNDQNPLFEYADFVDPGCWCRQDSTTARLRYAYRNPYQLAYATGAGLVSVPNTQVGAYVQDDWSPTSRLTLNLGIRWDFESNMINSNYVTPKTVADTLTRYNDSMPNHLDLSRYISTGNNRSPFYGAFQPRLGFSYALDKDNITTVFGGWGIYYDRSLFDFSVDEIQKLARPRYLVKFADPDSTPSGGQVAWNNSYLTADTSVISGLARSTGQPEAFLLDNKMKVPRATNWSLGVRRVMGSMVASLTYQGQRGTDLFTYNWQNISLDTAGRCCVNFNIGAHGFRNFIYSTNDGKTWYDALSFQLDRPYRHVENGIGWGGGVVYTYGRRSLSGVDALGDLTSSFPGGFPVARLIPKHSANDGNDERHHVVFNWITDLPYLAGVQFSGLVTLGSGATLDVGCPSRFCGPATYINGGFQPQEYHFLFLGGWAYRRVDFRLRKDFPQFSGTQLGVTLDVFNAFNSMNFGCYDTGFGSPNFGKASCVVSDPRHVQLGAEYTF